MVRPKINSMKNSTWILIGLLLFACSDKVAKKEEGKAVLVKSVSVTKKQIAELKIELSLPEVQLIGFSVHANGKIEVPPKNKTFISLPFGGIIKSISILDGDYVKKGEELVEIEHPEIIQLQQDYLEVDATLELLQLEVERQQTLVKNEAGSLKNLQQAKSNFNVAKAKKMGLRAKLEMANVQLSKLDGGVIQRVISIRAPFDGVVTKINANVGEFAAENINLLEIIDLKHAHAEVYVFEKDAKYIKEGQEVKIKMIETDLEEKATVYLVGKEVSKDRTIKVHCHFEKESSKLLPGSFFKATILTDPTNLPTISSESVVKIQNKDAIFVKVGETKDNLVLEPFFIRVLKQNEGRIAFEYVSNKPKSSPLIVSHETYEIMSIFTKINSGDEK
jgi:cobalt-zinc-cadmium efflux system membrane fusion protein